MTALARGYMLWQAAGVLVSGAVVFVVLLMKSLWVFALLMAVAWVAVAFLFRWLLQYKARPNEWLWQRGDSPGQVRQRLRERRPALVVLALMGAVLIAIQLVDFTQPVEALVYGGAILLAFVVTWIADRRRREGKDAE